VSPGTRYPATLLSTSGPADLPAAFTTSDARVYGSARELLMRRVTPRWSSSCRAASSGMQMHRSQLTLTSWPWSVASRTPSCARCQQPAVHDLKDKIRALAQIAAPRPSRPPRTGVDLMSLRHQLGEPAAHGARHRYLGRLDACPAELLRPVAKCRIPAALHHEAGRRPW
jgi:hypothetical protein